MTLMEKKNLSFGIFIFNFRCENLVSLDTNRMVAILQAQLGVPAGCGSVLATGLSLVLPLQWTPAIHIISPLAHMRQVTKALL